MKISFSLLVSLAVIATASKAGTSSADIAEDAEIVRRAMAEEAEHAPVFRVTLQKDGHLVDVKGKTLTEKTLVELFTNGAITSKHVVVIRVEEGAAPHHVIGEIDRVKQAGARMIRIETEAEPADPEQRR